MTDIADLTGALIEQLPPDVRADLAAQQVVAAAVKAGMDAATASPPPLVFVQRVDTKKEDGVETTFEVVDRRLPTGARIVGCFETNAEARAEAQKIAPVGGGAYVYSAVDSDEYWHDTDAEALANAALYNVISGLALSYDAANLTVDHTAGALMHSGTPLQIAAGTDAWTIVADASNERWTAFTFDSAGSATLVSGDPAASSSVEPTKPEIGDRTIVGMAKVQAAQTIAANCELKLDKRIPNPQGLIGYVSTEATMTGTSAADLITISKLGFDDSIPVTTPLRITGQFRKDASAAQQVGVGLKLNSTVVVEAGVDTTTLASSSGTQQAEDGWFDCHIAPRQASYLNGLTSVFATKVSATGAAARAVTWTTALTALLPNAAITSIVIRGINNTSNNNLEVTNVFVWAT